MGTNLECLVLLIILGRGGRQFLDGHVQIILHMLHFLLQVSNLLSIKKDNLDWQIRSPRSLSTHEFSLDSLFSSKYFPWHTYMLLSLLSPVVGISGLSVQLLCFGQGVLSLRLERLHLLFDGVHFDSRVGSVLLLKEPHNIFFSIN